MQLQFSATKKHTNVPYSTGFNELPINQSPIMMMSKPNRVVQPPSKPATIDSNIKNEQPRKMVWGEPTWFLFHVLAQKVKESSFPIIRKELIDVIVQICNNLPCPDCANHATQYMRNVNFELIRTKQDLMQLLYEFHNSVNTRKGLPLFPYADLEPKYSRAITVAILQHFMAHFDKKSYSARISTNNFHKSRSITFLKKWFTTHLNDFDP